MADCQIDDVNPVSNAGSVRSFPVISENDEMRSSANGDLKKDLILA